MSDVIQQLKNNKVPFGLMTEEMQAKAGEIGYYREFEDFSGVWGVSFNNEHMFDVEITYRLRPDYEETPEVLSYPIIKNSEGDLVYVFPDSKNIIDVIHTVSDDPDFIGCNHGDMLWGRLYRRKTTGQYSAMIDVGELDKYEVCDMTEAKVLFKGKKE